MEGEQVDKIDRLSVRSRPPGRPIMYQSWGKLLFMHWPMPVEALRPLIPDALTIDTFDGTAWIGVTPFTMWGIRPVFSPSLPALSRSHELNVRTYVYLDGIPGVWFLSLDVNNPLAVLGARLGYHLPYFTASMSLEQRDQTIYFASRRTQLGAPRAEFEAVWTIGERLGQAEPGSLDFFLIERYLLYSARGGRLYRARIYHHPWSLYGARLLSFRSTMIESQGLPSPSSEPLIHQQGEPLRVGVWPRVRVR